MAPMIDVIFLLLIFFVCTASFQPPEQVLPTRLSLPGSIDSEMPPEELQDLDEIWIKILWREGRASWEINNRVYDRLEEIHKLLAAIAQMQGDLPVILDVAPETPMEDVIDVYDLCRQVGLTRIQFAASVEES